MDVVTHIDLDLALEHYVQAASGKKFLAEFDARLNSLAFGESQDVIHSLAVSLEVIEAQVRCQIAEVSCRDLVDLAARCRKVHSEGEHLLGSCPVLIGSGESDVAAELVDLLADVGQLLVREIVGVAHTVHIRGSVTDEPASAKDLLLGLVTPIFKDRP